MNKKDKEILLKIVKHCMDKDFYLPWNNYKFLLLFYKNPNKNVHEIIKLALDQKIYFSEQVGHNLIVRLTQFNLLKKEAVGYKTLAFEL